MPTEWKQPNSQPATWRFTVNISIPIAPTPYTNQGWSGGRGATDCIGAKTVTYRARAVATGAFVALPTEAYAMYDLHFWGRSANSRFVVEE